MKSIYFERDDILQIRLTRDGPDKPIMREVSQDWHTHISYAKDGTVVEIVLLDTEQASWAVEKAKWFVSAIEAEFF